MHVHKADATSPIRVQCQTSLLGEPIESSMHQFLQASMQHTIIYIIFFKKKLIRKGNVSVDMNI